MNNILTTIKNLPSTLSKLVRQALHLIPTAIPVGVKEFDVWASDIISTYSFPDNDSVRWALAVKVLHMGETEAYKAKRYFYLAMHKAMANQVVSQVIQDLKTKQANELAAAQAAATPAVTTTTQAGASETTVTG
jgi:hypothetical protein